MGRVMAWHWIKRNDKGDHSVFSSLWRRFFARLIDFLIWLLLWYSLEEKFFLPAWQHNLAQFWLDQFAACGFMFLAEPVWLTLLSTTPGKALCGLGVRHHSGSRLTISQAARRAGHIWGERLGVGLPFYRLVCLARAYAARRQGFLPFWEKETSLGPLKPGGEGEYGRE
ncbi:MAG: RDD family protein [Clostridiaceae bacterium]|nr:RDD family protein [Clostridiaceae bacterium]